MKKIKKSRPSSKHNGLRKKQLKTKSKVSVSKKRFKLKKRFNSGLRKNKVKMKKSNGLKSKPKVRELSSFKPEDQKDIMAVMAVKKGNKEAFIRIMDRYRPFLVQRFFLKVHDRVLAEDLTAEVFAKVYSKLDKYEPTYTFNSWFYLVADRFLIDWSRKAEWKFKMASVSLDNARSNEEGFGVSAHVDNMPDEGVATDASLLNEEKRKAIKEGMETLEGSDRRLLIMFYGQDKSYKEIARSMKMNKNTMRVHLMEAKIKLAEYIKRVYPDLVIENPMKSKDFNRVVAEEVHVDGETYKSYSFA